MDRAALTRRSSRLAILLTATALGASACNRSQTASNTAAPPLQALPLTTTTTPSTPAPALSALPAAGPVRVARVTRPEDSYAYLDRAYSQSEAFADAPPDYAVDYEGERPWIWRGGDGSERIVERTPDGLRYFYYEPGASQPYLVQDSDYSYAYSGGQLAAVYGPGGRVLPYDVAQRRADAAGRYLAWAGAVYAASLNQQHQAVQQAHWDQQRADIAAERARWQASQSQQAAWADYHQAHQSEEDAHWADERSRRQAEAAHYAQSAPPPGPGYGPPPPGPGYGPPPPGPSYGGPPDYRGAGNRGPDNRGPGGYAGGPGPNGYDPRQVEAQAQAQRAEAERQRQQTLQQSQAQAQVQRQQAGQAHAAQLQAERQQQDQARTAEAARQAALQQGRAQAEAQRQAAAQAHAAQEQAQRQQQLQAQNQAHAAAEAQRQAALNQARGAAEAQHQAAAQAHAVQEQQRHAAEHSHDGPPHEGPPHGPHEGPHDDRDHPPGDRP